MTPIEAGSVNVPINTIYKEQGSGLELSSLLIIGLFAAVIYLVVSKPKEKFNNVQV